MGGLYIRVQQRWDYHPGPYNRVSFMQRGVFTIHQFKWYIGITIQDPYKLETFRTGMKPMILHLTSEYGDSL